MTAAHWKRGRTAAVCSTPGAQGLDDAAFAAAEGRRCLHCSRKFRRELDRRARCDVEMAAAVRIVAPFLALAIRVNQQ